MREKQEQQFYDEQAGMFLPDRYVEGTCRSAETLTPAETSARSAGRT